jgi:hypothetical protein
LSTLGFVELNGTTAGGAQITRSLAVPLTNATLSFDWDLDRLAAGDRGDVWIFDDASGAWVNVWNRDSSANGTDAKNLGDANFLNSGPIVLGGSLRVSKIRFGVTSGADNKRFYIDNVSLTVTATANSAPEFSSDPLSKTSASSDTAYTGQTLAGDATDPNSQPLTFSKLSKISGGTDWLTVSSSGVLAGTPTSADLGLNRWTVQASNSGVSDDTAILLIEVTAQSANPPTGLSYSSNPATYTKDTAITNNMPTSSGGAVVSYSVSPALPAGLTLNTSTGIISGTPTTLTEASNYTITATNTGGSTTASLSIAVVSAYTAWSTQYNLVQGPTGDNDGDGNSNYLEFVAGLVPTNASSVFKISVSAEPGQPRHRVIVMSPIISGRTYTVKSSESLSPPTWITLSNPSVSDAGNVRTVIDTAATEAKKFYVIEISNP